MSTSATESNSVNFGLSHSPVHVTSSGMAGTFEKNIHPYREPRSTIVLWIPFMTGREVVNMLAKALDERNLLLGEQVEVCVDNAENPAAVWENRSCDSPAPHPCQLALWIVLVVVVRPVVLMDLAVLGEKGNNRIPRGLANLEAARSKRTLDSLLVFS